MANEWWSLVQIEYPDTGVRTSPQLFSFHGDNFLYKPANNKKFDHLKTKWFYSQFGDATGTGGRPQDVIPLQDGDGNMLTGGPSGEKIMEDHGRSGSSDALEASLQKIQEMLESNASQIKSLTEAQSKSQTSMKKLKNLVSENTNQIKTLTEHQSTCESRLQQTAAENQEHLKTLADDQAKQVEQLQQVLASNAKASSDVAKELKRQRQQVEITNAGKAEGEACMHTVKPPPRKIDRPIVGYNYGESIAVGKGKPEKS